MSKRKPARIALVLGLGSIVLAACQTGPLYRPRGPGESVGYTDQRLTDNRFRVTFSGGTGTSREAVEDSLLRRAAEVTVQSGFSFFVFDARDTEVEGYDRYAFGPRTSFGFGFGSGRFGGGPFYWNSFAFGAPYGGYPPQRYEAYAEIVTLTPEQARNDPNAIDARRLLASLTPPPPPPPPVR